jgi:ATP-dependent exoDNAse (exonuclease V) beta subunit
VLERPNDETAGAATMCPGQHTLAGLEGYSVVWWDPGALILGAKPPFGVRREELIVKDVARSVVADGRSRYDRWHLARDDARAAGAVPSTVARTVREWTAAATGDPAELLAAGAGEVAVVTLAASQDMAHERAGGTAFGILVHAVLAQAPFDASRSVLENVAAAEARVLGMSDQEASAAATLAQRVFAHDLLARARQAAARGACRRETPVTLRLADGTVLEGIVDLAFEENGAWTIVDYKTDREIAATGEDRYRRQISLYASAIAEATGLPASGVLVRI